MARGAEGASGVMAKVQKVEGTAITLEPLPIKPGDDLRAIRPSEVVIERGAAWAAIGAAVTLGFVLGLIA